MVWRQILKALRCSALLLTLFITSFASAAPNATLTTNLDQNAFIGEQACFTAEFTNTSSDVGFGPYVLMTLPANIDPATISATLFEGKTTLSATSIGIIDAGATTPLTDDYSGRAFTAPDGFRLVRITFPVGSLTQASPPLDLNICATLPTTVAPNDLQRIQLTPVYRFGDSATGTTAIFGDTTPANKGLNPVLAIVKKENRAPEGERTPGPNFEFTYRLAVDIANGQTLTNINLSDALPANFQWTGTSATDITINNSNCSATTLPNIDPTPGNIVNTGDNPGGNLVITCNSVAGTTNASHNPLEPNDINGGEDIIVEVTGYITETLNEATCGTVNIDNTVRFNSEYQGNALSEQTANDRIGLTAKPAAVQKDVDNTTPEPGNTLTYTLNFQITDYEQTIGSGNSASVFEIVDVMPDGLTFDAASVVLTIDGTTVTITPTTVDNQGETTVTYNIAAAAQAAGVALDASTRGSITYTAEIDQTYEGNGGTAGEAVNSNDPLVNRATLNYQLADNTTAQCTDTTSERVLIKRILPNKVILNTNNATTMAQPPYQAGDIVFYQIQMTIESGDAENVVMTDILPLPVHLVGDVPTTLRVGTSASDTDASNIVYFASPDNSVTGVSITNYPPVVTTSTAGNSISFEFGDISVAPTQPITLTVNIPAVVSDEPFADGLTLANLLQVSSQNTNADPTTDTGITDISTVAPDLTLTKGVLSTSNASSTISSTTPPIDGDLTNADAGDVVTYRLTVDSSGKGIAYDVVVTEDIPARLNCPTAGVSVKDSSGNNLLASLYTVTTPTASSIQVALTNNILGAGQGALNKDGEPNDSVFVDIACTVQDSVVPNQSIENTASLVWASAAGASKYPALSDTATVTIAPPQIAKAITAVSPNPTGNLSQVTAGDTVTYDITVTLPEGTTENLTITDRLPNGFTYVSATVVPGSFAGTLSTSPTITQPGQAIRFEFFGNTVATGSGGTANNTFVIRLQALVADDAANDGAPTAQAKENRVTLTYNGQPTTGTISNTATTNFVEPELTLTKSMSPDANLVAGQLVTVTLTLDNTGTSTAYDLSVTDNLTEVGQILDLSQFSQVSAPAGFTVNYANPTVTYTGSAATSLTPSDAPLVFTFTAPVRNDVTTGTTLTNTATALGDSQPGAPDNQRPVTDSGSDDISSTASTLSKTLAATSENFTTGTSVAIGETFTYDIVFTLPVGTTKNVRLADVITRSFNGIALESATLEKSSANLAAANNPASINTEPVGTANTVTLTQRSRPNRFEIALGDVTNTSSQPETYTLSVKLRVANVSANTRNRRLQDRGRLYYENGSGTVSNVQTTARTVRVRLPVVDVRKRITSGAPTAGGQVTYELRIRNRGNAAGFDWTFTDGLPSELENPTTPVINTGSTGAAVNASFTGNNLAGTIDRLDPSETIIVTYTADVKSDTPFGTTVTNSAAAQTTTLDGNGAVEANERSGTGGVNNLNNSASASVTTNTLTLTKAVIDPQTYYAIGDIVHYRLTLAVPRGTTSDLALVDQLPSNMTFLTAAPNQPTITVPTDITVNPIITASGINVSGQNVTFLANRNITANAAGNIVIDYYAQINNDLGNQSGVNKDNAANANYDDPNSADPAVRLTTGDKTARITIGEPNVTVAKSASPMAGLQAGDAVTYTLTIENSGDTTAWQTNIRDQLPAGLSNIQNVAFVGTPPNTIVNASNAPIALSDVVTSTTSRTNDTLTMTGIVIPAGAYFDIKFTAILENTVVLGQQLINTATTTFASQQTGNSSTGVVRDFTDTATDPNDYTNSDSEAITVDAAIALQKTANKTNATIGENVIFNLRISLIEGVTPNVTLTDVLPAGLAYVSHNISFGHTGIVPKAGYATRLGSGQTVRFDFGNITNPPTNDDTTGIDDDYIDVQIEAKVTNVITNQGIKSGSPATPATVLSNGKDGTVTLHYGNDVNNPKTLVFDAAPLASGIQGVPVTVIEPDLEVTKQAIPEKQTLGDIVTFRITVDHTSDSRSDAFNLVFKDSLPVGMTYVDAALPPADVTANGQNLEFRMSTLALSADRSFTYRARINNDAAINQPLDNTIKLQWSNFADVAANGGRDGSDVDNPNSNLNDYGTKASDAVTPTADNVIDAKKTVTIAVDNGTAGVADPGDILEYSVTLNNTGSSAVTNVVFTDAIPANTSLVAGSLSSSIGTATAGDPIVVNGITSLAPNTPVIITFQVTIDAGTPSGTTISNQGVVDSNETVPEPTDADGVDSNGDQPTDITVGGNPDLANPLYAEKAVELWTDANNNGAVNPGDTLRYTIVLNNKGNTALTNVSLTDVIPTGLTYVVNTAMASASNSDVNINGQSLTWGTNTPMTIPPNGFVNVVFDVTVNNPLDNSRGDGDANTETFDNQADVSYSYDNGTTTKTTKTDSNGNPSDGNQPTTITATTGTGAPQLDVQKRVILASDNDNNGVANPNDTLTYTITIVNNGSAATDNARFSDNIPTQTSLVAGSVTTDYGVVTSGNADPIEVNLGSLKPGEVATVRFSVTVKPNTGGETAANQASVTGDNFPDAKSDDNGNSTDGINPTLTPIYDSNTTPPTAVSKAIVGTSESDSTGNNVLIGEIVTYEVTVTVPSGTLREASIVDTLPTGLGYVAGSAQLKRVFTTGLNAAANPNGINVQATNSYVDIDRTNPSLVQNGQNLSLFLGDVINSDSAAASYTLRYQAVVNNIGANTDGTTLSNSATLSYLTGLNQPASLTPVGQTVSVIEPDISVSKSASPTVILTTGGTVTFTIEVKNDGNAPAYDLAVTDTLPSGWTIANVNLGGAGTNSSTSNELRASIASLAVNATQTITVTVTAPNGLTDGATITNTARGTWTSLPGTNGTNNATTGNAGDEDGERTGGTGTGSNGYTTSDSADVKVGTPSLTKTVRNPKAHYAIGDVVEYQLELTVPAGLDMADAVISDVLGEGLLYITGSLNVATDSLTLDAQPSDFSRADNTPNAGEETLTFDTTGIENEQSDARTLTLTYSARVENIVENQNGESLGNAATVAYTNPGNTSETLTLSDNRSITVGEPHLALGKTITTPTTNLDAGDSVTYRVTVANDGTTTAFDTVLSDSLPTGLENITALTIDSTTPANVTRPTLTVSGANNTVWSSSAFDLGVNESLTLTFTATLANSVSTGQTLQNRVDALFTSQSGTNGNERGGDLNDNADQDDNTASDPANNYDVTATAPTITVADPIQFDKAFNPTTKTTYTIGEIVAYRLTLQLAEGTLDDVVITDTLPSGLTFVDGTVGLGNTNMTTANAATVSDAGQVITANLGQVVNPANTIDTDDVITVDIRARVDNITANQAGTVLGNNARVTYTDANGAQTRDFDADANMSGLQPLNLTIVEPNLTVSKTASVSEISLGDVVTYEITVAHDNSTATAYDITVTDTLPAGMTYVANSGTPAPTVNGQVLTFTVASLTQSTASMTITYQARMKTDTAVGATQTNNVAMTYASQPNANGDADNGRNGEDGTGNLNDYVDTATADVTPTANATIDATKTVAISNDVDNDGVADVGDTLRYTVTLQNTGSDKVTDVVFTDTLPTNTAYVGTSLDAVGSASATESAGLITVKYDELARGSSVTITFEVTINANTAEGTLISNQGSVDSNETVPEPTDVDGDDSNGDQPTDIRVGGDPTPANGLRGEKRVALVTDADGNGVISPSDTLRYTIVLKNTGTQPLTRLSFSDSIPTGLTYVSDNPSSGSVSVNGQDLAWTSIADLAAGASATLTFDVSIDTFATGTTAQAFVNQGTADSNETNAVETDGNDNTTDGNQPTTITATTDNNSAPTLDVQKRVTLSNDVNGNGVANPNDGLRYTITIANTGAVTASDVRFSDAIPTNTTLVAGSVTTSRGVIVNGSSSPITVNVGDLPAGQTASVSFAVQIDANTANGTIIANQASVKPSNLSNPVLSDDNGDASDGINPTLTPVSDAQVPTNAGISKTMVTSSEVDSIGNDVLIGEIVTFDVAVTMPIGTLREASIVDTLPTGLGYIAGSAQLKRTATAGLRASVNPDNINAAANDTFVTANSIVQTGRTLTLRLGDVINSSSTAGDASYTLRYQAVVENLASVQDASALSNSATLSYLTGLNQPARLSPVDQTVTVREPAVTVTKTAAPTVILPSGGTVTFSVVIANNGNAPAYDIDIADNMPTGWDLTSVNAPSGIAGVVDNSDLTAEQVRLTIAKLDVNQSITVTYEVTSPTGLSVGDSATNTARGMWTSLPNASNDERTGAGGVNDYATSDDATVRVGEAQLNKTISNPQSHYAVGEEIEYSVTLTLPAGLDMQNARVTDVLSTGLRYVSGSLQLQANGLSLATTPADFTRVDNAPNAGEETLTLNVGQITNTQTDARQLVLTYRAIVENVLSNQANTNVGNNVSVNYTDPGTGQPATALNSDTTSQIGEPNVVLTKAIVSPTVNLDAGDTVTYEVVIENNGTTTAFDTVLSDALPSGLTNITNLSVTNATGVIAPTLSVTGNRWTSDTFDLPVNATLAVRFTAALADTVKPNDAVQNAVTATFSSQSGTNNDARTGNLGDNADQSDDSVLDNYDTRATSPTFTVKNAVQLDKAFAPNAGNTAYRIGETVGYRVTLSLQEGTLGNVNIVDTLPTGLRFVSAQVGLGNTGMTTSNEPTPRVSATASGQTITFDLGNVVNPANGVGDDDVITVDINALVENIAANQDGVTLGNNAQVVYQDGTGVTVTLDYDADANTAGIQPLDLTVVEPDVGLSKQVTPVSVTLGDTMTFTLVLDHRSTSTADAFDLVVTDVLPAGMTYIADSAVPAPTSVNGQTLRFDIASLTKATGQTRITYRARLNANAPLGQALTNRASLTYGSIPNATGTIDGGRTGADGQTGTTNNYADTADVSVNPSDASFIDATKTVTHVDTNGTGLVNVGDNLRYTITLINNSEDATNVVFTDAIPANTAYVVGSLTTTAGTIDESANPLRVDIGNLAKGGTVTMTFEVTIASTAPINGIISNQGSVDSEQTVPEPTDMDGVDSNGDQPTDITVVAMPQLIAPVGKKVVNSSNLPELEWTVTWINPNTDGMLIRVTDAIPANSTFIVGSLQCQPQGSSTQTRCEFDAVSQQIVFEGTIGADNSASDAQTAANEIVLMFRVTVTDITKEVRNQAQAQWDSNGNATLSDENGVALTDDPSTSQAIDPTVWTPSVEPVKPKKIPSLLAWTWLLMVMSLVAVAVLSQRARACD